MEYFQRPGRRGSRRAVFEVGLPCRAHSGVPKSTALDIEPTKKVTKTRSCKNDKWAIGSREPSFVRSKTRSVRALAPNSETTL